MCAQMFGFEFFREKVYYLLKILMKNDLVKLITLVLLAASPLRYFLAEL